MTALVLILKGPVLQRTLCGKKIQSTSVLIDTGDHTAWQPRMNWLNEKAYCDQTCLPNVNSRERLTPCATLCKSLPPGAPLGLLCEEKNLFLCSPWWPEEENNQSLKLYWFIYNGTSNIFYWVTTLGCQIHPLPHGDGRIWKNTLLFCKGGQILPGLGGAI